MTHLRKVARDFKLFVRIQLDYGTRPLTPAEKTKLQAGVVREIAEQRRRPYLLQSFQNGAGGEAKYVYDDAEIREFVALHSVGKENEYLKKLNVPEYRKLLKLKDYLESQESFDQDLHRAVISHVAAFVSWFIANDFEVPIFDENDVEKTHSILKLRDSVR